MALCFENYNLILLTLFGLKNKDIGFRTLPGKLFKTIKKRFKIFNLKITSYGLYLPYNN